MQIAGPAARYLARLSVRERSRIVKRIDALIEGPRAAGAKPLAGRQEWSLRIGRRRALLDVDERARVVTVTAIGPRGDVYKA